MRSADAIIDDREKDKARFDRIVRTIIDSPATTATRDPTVSMSDLAYVIDYLKIAPMAVDKINQELVVQNTPSVTLLSWVSATQEDEEVVHNCIERLSSSTDAHVRNKLVDYLQYLDNLLTIAQHATTGTDMYAHRMWKIFIHHLTRSNAALPLMRVSAQLQTDNLHRLFGHSNDLVSLNIKGLRPMLSKDSVEKTIADCENLFRKYSPEDLGLAKSDGKFLHLSNDFVRFQEAVMYWTDMTRYDCPDQQGKLVDLANKVDTFAQTCSANLKKSHRMYLKRSDNDAVHSRVNKVCTPEYICPGVHYSPIPYDHF